MVRWQNCQALQGGFKRAGVHERKIGMKVGADAVIDPVHEEIGQRLTEILNAGS